jgi:pantoate--beta-alanine ligase
LAENLWYRVRENGPLGHHVAQWPPDATVLEPNSLPAPISGARVYKPATMQANDASQPEIDRSVAGIRNLVGQWRAAGDRIALVPTMGALHQGHIALVRAARELADRTVVSIFVNPTQFAANEDLATYPRDEAADLDQLAGLAVDAVFAPPVSAMYPDGFATSVTLGGPATGLETDFRPQFFTGVATVVAKLLIACVPDTAIFGEKDYQQLLVIRRMVVDLALPVAIVGHPTVREADGLALSSRNAYLSPPERETAPALHRALAAARSAIRAGVPVDDALAASEAELRGAGFAVDYIALRNAETLAPVTDLESEPLRLLASARLGKTRLIDNIPV